MTERSDLFSDRITDVPRSFIREILKVTSSPDIISFAGGLPNRDLFPVEAIAKACERVFAADPKSALQYSTTEGLPALRRWIAERYLSRQGLAVNPDNILITSGSQQGLDLLGKVFCNEGDSVAIEEPGYLGAIQAFSLFRPRFRPVPLNPDGIDIPAFRAVLDEHDPKLCYAVPNFQNPSGITWRREVREQAAKALSGHRTLFIEDDPYGDLRFAGTEEPSMAALAPEQTILLGSFSKVVAPGLRLGWIVASSHLMERLITAKQAADLHTGSFVQALLWEFLKAQPLDEHLNAIRERYAAQRNAMIAAIHRHIPTGVQCTEPEGGMFLWLTLPEGLSSMELFALASSRKVVFVPGKPFYTAHENPRTLRLNFSCVDEASAEKGIAILADCVRELVQRA